MTYTVRNKNYILFYVYLGRRADLNNLQTYEIHGILFGKIRYIFFVYLFSAVKKDLFFN